MFFSLPAPAQFSPEETGSAHSTSGQFIVTGGDQASPPANSPAIVTNSDYVRIQPALLAISAERLKESLRRQLGISPSASWSGQIFLALHPAQSPDENVNVISSRFGRGWNYRVELPDVVSRTRLARALTGVLLLEFADRNAGTHPSEIPAWLNDGLALQLLAPGSIEMILSPPDPIANPFQSLQTNAVKRSFDTLAAARLILQNHPALTFDELSWPTAAQLSGDDGGAYRASAQLFVGGLLGLKDGPACLRAMIESLPQFYNWQTAFQTAFQNYFPRPLDVEKWWALQAAGFVLRDTGAQWTPAVSRDKLDEILSVPVQMRPAADALPVHGKVSLQTAIRNFDPAQQSAILQTKLRDLQIAQFRMAPPLAVLADAYRRAIADHLGQDRAAAPVPSKLKHPPVSPPPKKADDIFAKLDALDAQRRIIEEAVKPDVFASQNLNAPAP